MLVLSIFICALVDWTQMRKYYFTIQLYLDNEETLPEALNAILIGFVVLFIICCCGAELGWMAGWLYIHIYFVYRAVVFTDESVGGQILS